MPFPLIAMAASALMPMVSKVLGGALGEGLGGLLGKMGNFGDILGKLFGDGNDRADDADGKQQNTASQANAATSAATNFVNGGQAQPQPQAAFSL